MEPEIPRQRRPFGVIVVALLQFGTVLVAIAGFLSHSPLPWEGPMQQFVSDNNWARGAIVLFAILVVIATVGMWFLRRWGWALMVTLVGVSLLLDLTTWWIHGDQDRHLWLYVRMGLDVVSAFYLNSAAVQTAFRGRSGDAAPRVAATAGQVGGADP